MVRLGMALVVAGQTTFFMKKDITYLIIIVVIGFIAFYFFNRNRILRETIDRKDSILAEKNDSLRYRRNREGQLIAEKLVAEGTTKEIASAYPKLAKELKDEFDVKIKDLKAYVKNEIAVQGKGNSQITNYYGDSTNKATRRRDLLFHDGYLRFSATIYDSIDAADSFYSYQDTITTIIHGRRKWFMGREKLFASSSLKNPNAKVIGTTNILVDSYKDKRFVVFVGVGYDPFSNKVIINGGLGYALFKF